MKNKRVEQKNRTHQRLIEAALVKMSEKGPSAVTTLTVAESAGVSHGTVFAHFSTKDVLLTEVLNHFGGRVAGKIHTLAADGVGLRGVLEAHLQGLEEYEGFYTGMVREAHLMPPGAQNSLILIQSAISLHMSEAARQEPILEAVRRVPFHFLFNLWIGLVHHYLLNAERFAPGQSVIARCGPELIENFIALLTDKSK